MAKLLSGTRVYGNLTIDTFVTATGNVTGNYFIGNGALLTGIETGFLTSTVNDFVGDGSTVAFTLSVVPGNENLTSVNISGVSQLRTAYSVTGNVMTFTSAPPNGSAVEVTVLSGTATSLANLVNGTTVIDIPVINGNATVSVGGNANVLTITGTGANVTGTVSATGNVTGGNLITAGLVSLSSITKSGTNGVGNIGAAGSTFNTVFAKATSAQYADLAEMYLSDSEYSAGTVVVFGGTQEITASTEYAQPSVAGVISTNPAYLMNSAADGQPVALQGRVPCRVIGNIRKGDLLTSSATPGVATRLDPADWCPGAVIGKALANYNSNTEGVIEAVVGRV